MLGIKEQFNQREIIAFQKIKMYKPHNVHIHPHQMSQSQKIHVVIPKKAEFELVFHVKLITTSIGISGIPACQ